MKKVLALLLALTMLFALAACGGGGESGGGTQTQAPANNDNQGGNNAPANNDNQGSGSDNQTPPEGGGSSELAGEYKLTIWCPEKAVDLTKSQIDAFNSSNTMGIKINATVEPVSEADAATNMINDVSAGADLFFFAQDQLSRMIQAGAVSKLGQGAADFVKANNTAGSLVAIQAGSDYYAYPLTADNGYLMYYDKSVIPDEDVDSLEKLIEDCEAAGKYFSYELENAWYNAGVFFGVGCHSDWVTDDEGNFISIDDDFNSDKGLIAAKGIYKLVSSPCYLNSSAQEGFENNCAIIVTGTWSYSEILKTLGDNMGTADLPSFTVDGQEYHLGSYRGCKLLGVKPQTDPKVGAVANQLAQWLTNKDCQLQRVETLGWGPSNIEATSDPITLANPAITALNLQNEHSVMQPNIHGSWWDIGKVITTDIKESDGSDDALRAALQKYYDSIQAVFTMSDEVKNAWTVIGAIGGSSWDVDFEMTKDGDVWTSNDTFELKAGDELKVRQGKNWDVSYGNGGENYVVEADGTYYITFNEATTEVALVPAG